MKKVLLGVAVAATIGGIALTAAPVLSQSWGAPYPHQMVQYGMSWQGMGGMPGGQGWQGMGCAGGMGQAPWMGNMNLDLDVEGARILTDAMLVMTGRQDLMVGAVTETGSDAFEVTIVNADGEVIETRTINTRTGMFRDMSFMRDAFRRQADLALDAEDAGTLVQAQLLMFGQRDRSLGEVVAKDGVFEVQVLDATGAIVQTVILNAATGFITGAK